MHPSAKGTKIIKRKVVVVFLFAILALGVSNRQSQSCFAMTTTTTTTTMGMLPPWMHRPAMVWEDLTLLAVGSKSNNNSNHVVDEEEEATETTMPSKTSCVYWEPQKWHSRSNTIGAKDPLDSTTTSARCCVTYRDLLVTAAVTVARLRKVLLEEQLDDDIDAMEQQDNDSSSTITGIPIVVAIPEGPWLPLAVLVVHALNRSFVGSHGNDNVPCFAILVPLEPSEAMERNRRILQDIQPRLVLCVSPAGDEKNGRNSISKGDKDRIDELVASISSSKEKSASTSSCQVIDFASFVGESLALHTNLSPTTFVDDFFSSNNRPSSLVSGDESWSLQDWVAGAADFLDKKENGTAAAEPPPSMEQISHIVYTSGTTGRPKGCVSSIQSLQHYLKVKNEVYSIRPESTVLLASALSFDPCLSDILATFHAKAALALAPRSRLLNSLTHILQQLRVTHVLCTPTLWGMVEVESNASSIGGEHDDGPTRPPTYFPVLQVVALGGEPIPKLIRQRWARSHAADDQQGCHLFATYGVTEACVYQTAGEILLEDNQPMMSPSIGQYVGKPFRGLEIRICKEDNQESLLDVSAGETGEVVLSGAQLDALTGYWKRPELAFKFVPEQQSIGDDKTMRYNYRTGDRGIVDPADGTLRILGRIGGEEGMVKVNGVRIELGEIEAALVDNMMESSSVPIVVESCMVQVLQGNDDASTRSEVHAYCVLSERALSELGLARKKELPKSGLLITGGVLLTLLRARCTNALKAACIPNAFVLLPNLPLSPTGKRDRRSLPPLSDCTPIDRDQDQGILLRDYGRLGEFLADTICECLNLQKLQQEMMTTNVTLDMLGGDSLAATRIIRALYAYHHQVENTRYLGGDYGQFVGAFDVVNLIRASNLGDYVDMLERNNIGLDPQAAQEDKKENFRTQSPLADNASEDPPSKERPRNALYDSLLLATTKGQSSIAIALLHAGADPNYGNHGQRLGKISGGFFHRKYAFHSSPLHLACTQGDSRLVRELLSKGANCKSPDAASLFPLHLVASSMDALDSSPEEDARRLECVKYLLDAGTPIQMRDGNHQTVLHAAARSGHSSILQYIMTLWNKSGKQAEQAPQVRSNQLFFNWMDRWYRTPVHWAILNGRTDALRIALELGSTPIPFRPKVSKRTSVAMEYPMELCDRLYPPDCLDHSKREMGASMRILLQEAIARELASKS